MIVLRCTLSYPVVVGCNRDTWSFVGENVTDKSKGAQQATAPCYPLATGHGIQSHFSPDNDPLLAHVSDVPNNVLF